jgi:hypothetical protein
MRFRRGVQAALLTLAVAVGLPAATASAATCGSQSTPPGVQPTAAGEICGVDITGVSGVEFSGVVATYTVSGAGTLDGATVEWGDGTSSPATRNGPNANGGGQFTASHVYAQPNSYPIRITSTGTYNGQPLPSGGSVATAAAAIQAPDSDADGVRDDVDNCVAVSNPDQANGDKDALGDVCDADHDNDGKDNAADACPLLTGVPVDGCPDAVPTATVVRSQSIRIRATIAVKVACAGSCARLAATGAIKSAGKSYKLQQATTRSVPAQVTLLLKLSAADVKALRTALRNKGAKAEATITVATFSPSGRQTGRKVVKVAVRG